MRVLVNGLAAAGARTGIGHYTSELLRCLRAEPGPHTIGAFPPPWLAAARRWIGPVCRSRLEAPESTPAGNKPAARSWKSNLLSKLRSTGEVLIAGRFRAACRRGRYDLYHEPNVIPLPADLPTVTTVHDLSVLLHPEWHPSDRVVHYEKHFAAGVARSVHVLTVSEFARREIVGTLGLPPERVSVTYNGIRPNLLPLTRDEVRAGLRALGLPPRYLLFIGTLEPRKNVLMLLRAYCSLPGWLRERYPLLLVGSKGWNSSDIHELLDREGRHKGVIHRGYLADEYLATLYNGARALLFPSWYEGFGLPPVEMLACGGAVLASTAGAVAEVVGRQAHLIDPADGDGWRRAMMRVATDEDWWQDLRRGATEAARPFTWERCAAETLAVYERAAAGERSLPRAA
jgi:glycosyltransferase involved in cell wall biosynthesis